MTTYVVVHKDPSVNDYEIEAESFTIRTDVIVFEGNSPGESPAPIIAQIDRAVVETVSEKTALVKL